MSMSRYYRWCVLYPPVLSILVLLGYAAISEPANSAALGFRFFLGTMGVLIVQTAVILALLFAPLFLNSRGEVRDSTVKRYLSWWLLPGIYFIWMFSSVLSEKPENARFDRGTGFVYLALVLHISGSLIGWYLFNKELEKEQKELEQYNS